MATSADEFLAAQFVHALCDSLAECMIQAMPSKYSPKKLVERSTKGREQISRTMTRNRHRNESVEISASTDPRFTKFPMLYGDVAAGIRAGMIPHLLSNKVTTHPRNRHVSARDILITPLPAAVEQIFARDTSAVLKTYNPLHIFVPVQEHALDPLPFVYIQGVVHPYTIGEEFP
jgi:hypothetical protein